MQNVSGTEIENINDSFQNEYKLLLSLLFQGNEIRTIDEKVVSVAVDKCIIELKRFKKLTKLK